MENYIKTAILGEGTYGVVYKAIHKSTRASVALKMMRVTCDQGVPSTTIREISILKELSHPNIVQLQEVLIENNKLCLVFELLPMDLKTYLDFQPSALQADLVQSYMYQVMLGIVYCHSRRIIHRDLKPQNLLINEAGIIKIADFGLARTFGIPMRAHTHEVLTLWYRAPELLLGSPSYSTPVDVWAIGTVMAELATRRPLFRGNSEIDQLFCIFRVLGTPSNEMWDKVESLPYFKMSFPKWKGGALGSSVKTLDSAGMDLLSNLLIYNPATRISAKRALLHPYFNSLDKTSLPATFADTLPR